MGEIEAYFTRRIVRHFVFTIFLGTLSYVFSQAIRTHFADYKIYAIGVFFVAWGLLLRKLIKSQ